MRDLKKFTSKQIIQAIQEHLQESRGERIVNKVYRKAVAGLLEACGSSRKFVARVLGTCGNPRKAVVGLLEVCEKTRKAAARVLGLCEIKINMDI